MVNTPTPEVRSGARGHCEPGRTCDPKNHMPPLDIEEPISDLGGSSRPATMIALGSGLFRDVENDTYVLKKVSAEHPHSQAPNAAQTTTRSVDTPSAKYAKRLDAYFDRFFTNVAAVSTLGSSITLALIVSQLQDPRSGVMSKPLFDLSTVRILIATSWLLFTTTLMLSFLLAGMLKWWRSRPDSSANDGFWILGALYVLMGGAFFCLSLAVAAYVEVVGFIAVAVIGSICLLPLVVVFGAVLGDGVELIRFLDHVFLTAGPLREDDYE